MRLRWVAGAARAPQALAAPLLVPLLAPLPVQSWSLAPSQAAQSAERQ
jgi:hypothetical protein